jgi:hypothetical protein
MRQNKIFWKEDKIMKVGLEIEEQLYKKIERLAKNDGNSIEAEIEKAIDLMIQKHLLIKRLMEDTCDEFDNAMRRLA